MKKNYLFTMVAMMMLAMTSLTGCDKDDDGISGNAEDLIVGEWQSVRYEGYEIYEGAREEWSGRYTDNLYTFYRDGSGRFTALDSYEDSYSFDWVIDGDELILDEGTWDEARCTIEKLNGSTLVLYYFEEDPREDYEYHERETFERVGDAR